jgi:SAM-dependent methyltransferase
MATARASGDRPVRRTLDAGEIVRELRRYRAAWEDPNQREYLIVAARSRIQAVVDLLPPATPDSHLLELGASPFFNTVCIERVWPGKTTLTNYGTPAGTRGSQRLVATDGSGDRVVEYDLFDIETDEFPYPDASFDVVVFSELIEHLSMNPVWALSEIHRVLKPGGHVIITTPNALSLERLSFFLRGTSHDDDRYAPHLGAGARHNREYRPWELEELLMSTGFTLETLAVRDLVEWPFSQRLVRAVQKNLLRLWSRHPHGTHIFLRARRGDAFRWVFPPFLYAHMSMYALHRHAFVEMGVNDTIQCGQGWLPLEEWKDGGGRVRRVSGPYLHNNWMDYAIALLRAPADARRLVVRLTAAGEAPQSTVEIRLLPFGSDREALARGRFEVSRGRWLDAVLPLAHPPDAGAKLSVHIEPAADEDVAVRRIWLDDRPA